jgi:hypothetical protein
LVWENGHGGLDALVGGRRWGGGLVIMVNRGGWLYELKREFKSWSVRLEWLVMVVQVGYK